VDRAQLHPRRLSRRYPHLTPQGKAAAKQAKKAAAIKALADVSTPRLAGLDADVAAHRMALLPASTEKIEARRIDFLLSHLRDRTPQEISVFYNSATDNEKLVLEEAARSVGRIPTKKPDGSLAWAPVLPAETINGSIIARATAKNPQEAAGTRGNSRATCECRQYRGGRSQRRAVTLSAGMLD
jgi:hypothetical protein